MMKHPAAMCRQVPDGYASAMGSSTTAPTWCSMTGVCTCILLFDYTTG
jgi:hypothetical protein